ncbi:mucin-12 [Biomphalaria pfeifferi]|uniref:Mucin-12 n=1 Tax=Biomphalaria pfeifferi TaxID=112525 RepID=A0AAD8AT24_BIOPF|nr:mucin-12 [Biomphalaria pfeifferi]
MPVTGNLNQETESQVESEAHLETGDNTEVKASDCVASQVSSTTDSDPFAELALENAGDTVADPVQSTTSLEASSDSLDGFKNSSHLIQDPTAAKSSNAAPTSQYTKGFQDAFAAFASASFREEEEEIPMEANSNSAMDPTNEPVVSTAADTMEQIVSSAIDSGIVSTTNGDTYIKHTQNDEVAFVASDMPAVEQQVDDQIASFTAPETETQSLISTEQTQASEPVAESQVEATSASDSVYFIQTTDATGQVLTSIIDPNDIPAYADSIVYKQCMLPDGNIETTIVSQGGQLLTQEEHNQEQASALQEASEQVEPQIIYVHDANGQLTPIDTAQSANDVAPPGKQFVYMQDSTGRIIRTIMDANQTMVPGQQVYYTQSEDGRIITSVMDSATAGVTEEGSQQSVDQLYQQQTEQIYQTQEEAQQQATMSGSTTGFNIDNTMSGLSMLAELSHLTAGQATESRTASSTESNSMDMDEFRPVAMVTRRMGEEGDTISTDLAGLKVGETDSGSLDPDQGSQDDTSGQEDSVISKLLAEMKTDLTPSLSVSRDNLFVQWQNLDAMCWMDVVLIMLVYSPTLRPLVNLDPTHELASTLLITLLKANRQAQVLLQNLLKKSNGAEISSLQTGAGNSASLQDPKTSKLVCKENMDEIGKAINILYAMREKIWQALQPRLRCERGKHNSPVLVLPLLVREKPAIKQMFTMNYRYVFKCEVCGYSQDDAHTKILPSIPAVPADFNMMTPSFVRNCFECQAPNQRMLMKFEGLQDFVQMHFVKGLPHSRFEELSFDFNEDHYEVTTVVHYKNNPDHFIAWVRNAPGATWMECDDLKSVITRYQHLSPNIPPSQVHMVMWERRLTQQHTLVMRDTEDTKLLASLVLTVQQPNTHQITDPAARPTGAPSTQFPMHNAPKTNSLLSGLNAQLSNSTPRGRGRGGRGNRGGYALRGRGTSSTAVLPVRRPTPTTITQLATPTATSTPRARTAPQTIRVPISSLTGGMRTISGEKIVLLSSNAQGGLNTSAGSSTGSTTSKVVVVRSPGGPSNITAAQILQLLQRTGAISGGRVTTTINTSSNVASTPQSYIIQPDGSVINTSTVASEPETPTQVIPEEPSDTNYSSMNEQATDTSAEVPMETNVDKGEPAGEESSQVPDQNDSQISTLPFPSSTPGREQTSQNETIIVSPETASPSIITEENEIASASVAQAHVQQPTKYIQIPNPSGSGTILTQLTMRGGKMVLIPVSKTTQAQLTSGSAVLKLPTTPTGSPKISIRNVNPQIISASSAGALLSQLHQQQISQVSNSGTSTVSTIGGQKHITLPGTSGQKKTIQVITVPASQSIQSVTKKILSPSSGHHSPSSALNTLLTTGESSGRILSQSGNIVIRELKKADSESAATLTPSLGSPSHLLSTPAVSLLKDVSARSGVPASSQQQKNQESFRYILQGSSTTHILNTGTSTIQSSTSGAGRAFTALSSSGTIIGGQLTPSPTTSAMGTSPMDQDLSLSDIDDATASLTPSHRLSMDMDATEYIPLGRGRSRGRGLRGRGSRGGRTPRGRGRSQLWSVDTDYIPSQPSSRKISTLPADLRQIGAHVIESGSEAVDGVPVVSIPDFTTEEQNHHTEAVPQTLEQIPSDSTTDSTLSALSELASQISSGDSQLTDTSLSPQGPRVITQAIPSIKANHGFDILTQGILGSSTSRQSLAQPKQARSLLTGSPVTIPANLASVSAISSTTTILDASEMISAVSKTPQSVQMDTYLDSDQDLAKQDTSTDTSVSLPIGKNKSPISTLSMDLESFSSPIKQVTDYCPADTLSQDIKDDKPPEEMMEETCEIKSSEEVETVGEERVMSFDDSQVSAAERYRMPMELFQPDEESPEKNVRPSPSDFPSKFFQDSEMSSQEEEISMSPKGAARHKTLTEIESDKKAAQLDVLASSDLQKVTNRNISKKKVSLDLDSSVSGDVDIESTEKVSPKTKKAQAKKLSHHSSSRGKKKGKSKRNSISDVSVDSMAEDHFSPLSNVTSIVASPAKEIKSSVKPKSANIGGFATDLLKESEEEEIAQKAQAEEKKCDNKPEPTPVNEDLEAEKEDAKATSDKEPEVEVQIKDVAQTITAATVKSPKRKIIYNPAVVPFPKIKVDWTLEDSEQWKVVNPQFNYSVLQGKPKTLHHPTRWVLLQDNYMLPPSPFIRVPKEKPIVYKPPVVVRRMPKPLQRPTVDPSKEPTVIPLVAEEEWDPSYTGGSVVTSPVDGEIFTGVIIKKKTETADWSSFMDDVEDPEIATYSKSASHEYCEHLLTEYYITAVSSGDYTYLESSEENQSPETETDNNLKTEQSSSVQEMQHDSKVDKEDQMDTSDVKLILEQGNQSDSKQILDLNTLGYESPKVETQLNASLVTSTVTSPIIFSPSTKKDGQAKEKKRRGRPKKDMVSKLDTGSPNTTLDNSLSSKLNGIDNVLSSQAVTEPDTFQATEDVVATTQASLPITNVLPAQTVTKDNVAAQLSTVPKDTGIVKSSVVAKDIAAAESSTVPKDIAAAQTLFPSPSRRSGRTPIPSKRVLDALEDSPARLALKGRRASLVSSDDEPGGYNTGESAVKKLKKHALYSS